MREIETRGAIETAKRVRQRISAAFVHAIAKGIATSDPAEKLGAVLKPLPKGRQAAITDIVPLRKMILAAEEDNARPITRLGLRMLSVLSWPLMAPFSSLMIYPMTGMCFTPSDASGIDFPSTAGRQGRASGAARTGTAVA